MPKLRRLINTALVLLLAVTTAAAQDYEEDAEWLREVLQLREGSVVADIGAGGGELTVLLADLVGPDGKVYATELGEDNVEELREEVEESSASNITVLEGGATDTNLPEECCNALVMRRVYHHINNPPPFNASLLRTLKPGGRLAVIDFEPRGSPSEDAAGRDRGSQHGVTLETVEQELTDAGFILISSEDRDGRDFAVVAEKPDGE